MNRFLQLFRPVVIAMGLVFLIAAMFISSGGDLTDLWKELAVAAFAVVFFVIGGNSVNDYADRDIDKISHPERPIPSGRMDAATALRIGVAALLLSSASSLFLPNIASTAIVLGACAFIAVYELILKKMGLVGNLAIAVITSMVFLLGGAVAGNVHGCLIIAAAVLMISFAREIILDVADMKGDAGRRTIPMIAGVRNANILASAFLLIAAMLTLIPFASDHTALYYSVIAADLLIFITIWSVFRFAKLSPMLVAASMFAVAASFVLGAV